MTLLALGLAAVVGTSSHRVASAAEPGSSSLSAPVPRDLTPRAGQPTIYIDQPRTEEDVVSFLRMERGKTAFVKTAFSVRRASVGDPSVVDIVVLSPRELQFVANSIGATNVVLWDAKGAPMAAIDVSVGTPYSHLQGELRRVLGNGAIEVDSAGESVVLKGTVPNALAMEQALTVAEAFVPDETEVGVINLLEVGGDQQVMIEVKIAEMDRTLRRRMGTNFALQDVDGDQIIRMFGLLNNLTNLDSEDATGTIIQEISQNISFVGQFFGFGSTDVVLVLDLLTDKGLTKILAEPNLIARSGESADFLVGGEVPIPIAQGGAFGSITIEFKEFGVAVSFTPTVLGPERIHLAVTTEVSQPDFSIGTTFGGFRVPGFNTRRASTGIDLGDGETFAIAGLLREDIAETVAKYPLLGDIPILGSLFRSSQFQKQETELVLIVTPRLVEPLGPGPHPLPGDHYVEPNDFEFFLLGAIEGRVVEPTGAGLNAASAGGAEEIGRAATHGLAQNVKSGGMIGALGHRIDTRPQGGMQ
jgi:pilus assembly protein CpaC